ncbi:hypothetical protein CF326_g2717 [Tilletia indica]|uniref:Uncharacterized protein n=1 Tax=Tilletia indica TaxID=43049 RepID=A0A177TW68_9BASI|nr:hypothetical protein CF326_g2717 [Tilletia indica]KAE8259326.1 hypothetical protein A4X13_0g1090 [Tilletia indica]
MAESKLPPLAQASAGAFGSSVANSLVYPLDMLSTRAQTQTSKANRQSIFASLQAVVRKNGVAGLYQGWGADTLSNSLSNFLFFFFRSVLVSLIVASKAKQLGAVVTGSSTPSKKPKTITLSGAEDLAAGALAGAASRLFTTPLSNVVVRKQTNSSSATSSASEKGKAKEGEVVARVADSDSEDEGEYAEEPSILDCMREIVREKGVLGLWSGFETAAMLSITPALTFYFTHAYMRLIIPGRFRDKPLPAQTFLSSALGNATATLVVFPLILAKSRLQSGKRGYKSLPDVVRSVIRRQGMSGLYAGLETQLVKGFVSQGTTMLVKDRVEAAFIQWYKRLLLERAARQ